MFCKSILQPGMLMLLLLSCSGNIPLKEEYRIKERLTGVFVQASPANAHLIFEETFEGRSPFAQAHLIETGPWAYALQYVDAPVFQGRKAVRFEIRKNQPLVKNGKRSEVCIVKGLEGTITKETWYSFMVYCPSAGYAYDTDREIINQWYQDGTPAMSIRTHKDRFLLESGSSPSSRRQYDLGAISKNRWHEFVLHVIHSPHSDGLVEVWRDARQVLTVQGGNMYDSFLPKWKIGLYKAGFKTEKSLVDRRVIYFDNIRVGNKNAGFKDMTSL